MKRKSWIKTIPRLEFLLEGFLLQLRLAISELALNLATIIAKITLYHHLFNFHINY